jgi:hypothetical protein
MMGKSLWQQLHDSLDVTNEICRSLLGYNEKDQTEIDRLKGDCVALRNEINTLDGLRNRMMQADDYAKKKYVAEIDRLKVENESYQNRIKELESYSGSLANITDRLKAENAKLKEAEPGFYEALVRVFREGVCGLTVKDKQRFMHKVFDSDPFRTAAGAECAAATDHLYYRGQKITVTEEGTPQWQSYREKTTDFSREEVIEKCVEAMDKTPIQPPKPATRRYRNRGDHLVEVKFDGSNNAMFLTALGWMTLLPRGLFDLLFEPEETTE